MEERNIILRKKIILPLLIVLLLLFNTFMILPGNASDSIAKAMVYVDDDADPSWYDATHVKTIQEGINNASIEDTIFVYNGTYNEMIRIDKQINLIGEDKTTTIINEGTYSPNPTIEEGFENGFPPENWSNAGWLDSLYGYPHSGSHWAYAWGNSNVLTTPSIQLFNNPELSFWTCAESSTHPVDLEVYCNGNLIFSDYGFTYTSYQKQIIDLSAFEDEAVVIEFVGYGQSYYGQCLDDITIVTGDNSGYFNIISVTENQVNISGFTIQNGIYHTHEDAAVYINAKYCNLTDVIIKNNNVTAIRLIGSDYCLISNTIICNNTGFGIYEDYGSYGGNQFCNNHMYNNSVGIMFGAVLPGQNQRNDFEPFTVFNNIIEHNICGIQVNFGSVTIFNNHIQHNTDGIKSVNNPIPYPVSKHINIYHNNFINNTDHTDFYKFAQWNQEYPSGGNYYDNYNGTDLDQDGIGDTPYKISENAHILYETFTSGIGGTVYDGDGSGFTWELTTQLPDWTIEPTGNVDYQMAIMDDDAAGSGNNNGVDSLIIPLDCRSATNMTLDFDGTYNHFLNGEDYFNITINNNEIYNVSEDTGFGSIDTINITNDVEFSRMNLSFNYNDCNTWAYGVVLDNIFIKGDIYDRYPLMNITEFTKIDINQSMQNRGFPIRHAVDGDWGGAQNFTPTSKVLSNVDILIRKFGEPEFDFIIEIRKNSINGPLLGMVTIAENDVPTKWTWLNIDFPDILTESTVDYFIKCPPAPSGVTTSFGYEWGYAFGNQYDDGSFWFTRDGGALWRDLPNMYEFVFKTYGYN